MSIRNLTKVPKLSLVYFSVDQSTCVLETKKLRRKDTGESYTECSPEKMAVVTIRCGSKQLEALVIASDGRSLSLITISLFFVVVAAVVAIVAVFYHC